MRGKPRDKARGPGRNKVQAPYTDRVQVDDFSSIPGLPAFAIYALQQQGILTFAQLRAADLQWLHAPVQVAIERWRDG